MNTQVQNTKNASKIRKTENNNAALGNSGNAGHPRNICGWTITRKKNRYFEGRKRIGGKVVTRYIGTDLSRAREILGAQTEADTIKQTRPKQVDIVNNSRNVSRCSSQAPERLNGDSLMRSKARFLEDMTSEEILAQQRPAKLCRIMKRCGFGEPTNVELNTWAKFIRLSFASGLVLVIRPRHLEVKGVEVKDEELEGFLKSRQFEPIRSAS
ncbi:MAG: hypothetical protein ACLQPD_00360 [Desulfomonilaceae bacterium]